jgi:hypothetical protein
MDTQRVLQVLERKRNEGKDITTLCPTFDKNVFTKYETQKFPVWVYKQKLMSEFGIFTENLIKYYLIKEYPDSIDKSRCTPVFLQIVEMNPREAVNMLMILSGLPGDKNVNISLLTKIRRDIKETFGPSIKDGYIIVLDFEVGNDKIVGHPDILWTRGKDVGIIDVKTVSKPSTNYEKHLQQISAYAALMGKAGANVFYFGFYYPLHKNPAMIMEIPVGWNPQPLFDELNI